MKLYFTPISQHSRRVVSLLEQENIPYEAQFVDMMKGEYLSEAFLAINPNHQVPVLVDGDLKIFESNAILRYICGKYQLEHWYPSDPVARARVDQWLDWTQCRLSPAVVDIVLNRVFMKEEGDVEAIDRGIKQMEELSSILEQALEGQPYLAGDQPTIADLALASNIFHLSLADEAPESNNIRAWYDRISSLEGFRKSLPDMPTGS